MPVETLNYNLNFQQYHVEKDAVQHCALADVQRWAFIFADRICDDLNIERIAGQHNPPDYPA